MTAVRDSSRRCLTFTCSFPPPLSSDWLFLHLLFSFTAQENKRRTKINKTVQSGVPSFPTFYDIRLQPLRPVQWQPVANERALCFYSLYLLSPHLRIIRRCKKESTVGGGHHCIAPVVTREKSGVAREKGTVTHLRSLPFSLARLATHLSKRREGGIKVSSGYKLPF